MFFFFYELGAAPAQDHNDTALVPDAEDTNEEAEEDEPTPIAEKDPPIPPVSEEGNGDTSQAEIEEEEEALKDPEDDEDKTDKEGEEDEIEGNEEEEPKSECKTEEVTVEEESKERNAEEDDEEEDGEDEDDDTTADLLTTTDLLTDNSPIKYHSNKSNQAKTNGHVLLGTEGLKTNPGGAPPPPSPTPEPLLCPLVESELSYTDRDHSLSSGYEKLNGELTETGLTNGSSERHRATIPIFPDLPLDPEPGNPVSVGTADIGAGPSLNSPAVDRSRTVSSSSTGDTPKGGKRLNFCP